MNFKFLFNSNFTDSRLLQKMPNYEAEAQMFQEQQELERQKQQQQAQQQINQISQQGMAARGISTTNQNVATPIETPVEEVAKEEQVVTNPVNPVNKVVNNAVTNPFTFNGQAVDFTYNKDLSARQNRKLLKKKLKSIGGDKADATGMISEYWAQNGGASGSDKKWLDARASQYGYTTDANGNRDYHRKPGNWGKALATIGGALLGGPLGAAGGYMLASQKSQIPGLKNGFFDPTSVKPAAQTQPVTEQPVVEQPVVEQPAVEQPVTGFDPSKGVTFSGFSGDWGTRAQQVYDANKDAAIWGTIAGDDNEITQDEFMAWQRANNVAGGADGKLGRNSLAALGFGNQQSYSWMNPKPTDPPIKGTMGKETVITPETIHQPGAVSFANASAYGYNGDSYEHEGNKYVSKENYDNWFKSLSPQEQYYINNKYKRVPMKGGGFAYQNDGNTYYTNGTVRHKNGQVGTYDVNSGKYTWATKQANPGQGTFSGDGYLAQQQLIKQNEGLRMSNAMGHKYSYKVGNKSYPIVVTDFGSGNVHNDRTFFYDPETQMYTPAQEHFNGAAIGFMPSEDGMLNWYTLDELRSGKRYKGTDYSAYRRGGTLKYQQGGQLDDQDKMLLASTLGMIGYAASQGKQMQIEEAAAQVASLAQSQPEALQELASNKELVNAGVQAVGQETVQQLSQPGVMKQLLTQVSKMPKAMNGTKLNYIKELKGICPEGYEMQYFATGGNLCQRCMKSKKIEEAKCGKKMKKHEDGDKVEPNNGAVSSHVQKVKQSMQDSLSKNNDKNWRGPIATTPRVNTTPSKSSKSSKRLISPHPATHRANIENKSKK